MSSVFHKNYHKLMFFPNPIFVDILNDVIELEQLSKFFHQNHYFPFLILQNPIIFLIENI
jgi:hypothetical protein